MSTQLVRQEIERFLASTTPEVLCIRGKWGTGKTYNWNDLLYANKYQIALKKYAYVSLFSLNSIGKIRLQLFQSTIPTSHIGNQFSLEDVEASIWEGWKWGKKALSLAGRVFSDEDSMEVALSLTAMAARNQLICFDDLERKGADLRSADVLGLISDLKEQRGCKIVLLLNDEQLKDEDKNQFEGFLEKVVDINVRFAPSSAESIDIALRDAEGPENITSIVRERCLSLGVDNVRVIRKLHRLVCKIAQLLSAFEPDVLQNVATSLVLFGWSYYQPELAPSLEYLTVKKSLHWRLSDDKDATPQEKEWDRLLRDYGYHYTSDFDHVLIQGVADGYFNQESVDRHATELHEGSLERQAREALTAAWQRFDFSFNSTKEEVVADLEATFRKQINFCNLAYLGQYVRLFRDLQENEKAREMIDLYIATKKDVTGAFNQQGLENRGQELPEDLREVVLRAHEAQQPDRSIDALFKSMGGYNSETNARLATVSADEYYRAFKSHDHGQLRNILSSIADLRRISNISETEKTVLHKAGQALQRISEESDINRMRARSWGIIQWREAIAAAAKRRAEAEAAGIALSDEDIEGG